MTDVVTEEDWKLLKDEYGLQALSEAVFNLMYEAYLAGRRQSGHIQNKDTEWKQEGF